MKSVSSLGHRADVDAAGDHLRQSQRHRQRAEGHDQRGHLGLGDQHAVDDAPRHAADDRGDEPDGGHTNPLPPIASITLAATTDENTRTEPTDRSMPEVMITNVIPTPITAQTATFCEISEKLPVDRKRSPAMRVKNRQMTIRTPRIQNA